MSISNLHELFVHGLQDVLYAEKHILKKLPKMAKQAHSAQLKNGFERHAKETEGHVARLEAVFESIGEKPKAKKCPGIEGIAAEAEEVAGEIEDAETLDAALLASAQAVEHYEVTRYGTLIAWAEEMGHNEAAKLLTQTLDEEKATDAKLTKLAESRLNRKAMAA